MTRDEAHRIVEQEGLTRIVWFDDPKNQVEMSGIGEDAAGWYTYVTNERAAIEALSRWSSESEALEDLLDRARLWQRIERRRAERRAEDARG